jgi:hypothetical protein
MNPEFLNPYLDLVIRLGLDISLTWLIIIGIYFKCCKKRSFIFCLFMFNLIIFVIAYIISNSTFSLGAGLGLFALFTMLRYRSESLNIREMTYLFIIITIGFINSTSQIDNFWIILLLDTVLLVLIYLLEKYVGSKVLSTEKIKYNNLELLKPQYRNLLLKDLFLKTGVKARSIDIESISLSDETATIIMYYDENEYKASIDQKPDSLEVIPEGLKGIIERNGKRSNKSEPVLRVSN